MGRLKGWAPDIVAISGTALPTDGRFRFVASDRTGRPWVTLLVASWRPRNGVRFKLLKRVFDLDLQHCPNCGGELRIIAAILEPSVIEKILTHLGLQAGAPPRAPARGGFEQAA